MFIETCCITAAVLVLVARLYYFHCKRLKKIQERHAAILQDLQEKYPELCKRENWEYAQNLDHWWGFDGMRHKISKDFVGYCPETILDDPECCYLPESFSHKLSREERQVLNDWLLPTLLGLIREHNKNVRENNINKFDKNYSKKEN